MGCSPWGRYESDTTERLHFHFSLSCIGEGNGNPLQCSWASLVAQLVKNPPAVQETWVQSLGWEDPPEKGKATHSSILAWRIPWTVHGVAKSRTRLRDFHFHFIHHVFLK